MKEKVTIGKVWGIIYPMLLYTAITIVVTMLLSFVLTVLVSISKGGTISTDIATAVSEGIYNQLMLVTLCAALATLPLLIFFRYRDIKREKLNGRFKRYEGVFFAKYLLIIPFSIFSMMSANYFVNILTAIMPKVMTDSYQDTAQIIYGSGLIIQIIAGGIICPIVEEMIFRVLIYNRIKKMASVIPAAIISSVIFGIYHGNWVQAPYAFIIGMVCVYVYEKYKSIVAPMILHITANLFSVIISSLVMSGSQGESVTDSSIPVQMKIYVVFTWITGVLAFAIALIIKKVVKPKEMN